MTKQGAKTVMPRLRFPEFRQAGSWRETKLGVIAESESSSLALNKVALEPQGFPLFGADGLVGRIAFFEQPDGYIGIVKDGSGVGRLTLLPAKSSVLGTLAYVKPALGAPVSLDWLFHCMASLNLKKYVKGSGIPHIYFADYSNEPIGLPAPAEQQKIADCLTSLDEVIAAQGRKLDALKAHKRGLMQQLFPREGETRPRLRFPEFRDAPEWRETPLGDLVDLLSGYPFDGKDIVEDSSGEPLMRGINLTEGAVRHSVEIDRYYLGSVDRLEKFRLRKNDLVIGMDGSKVGKNSALIGDEDVGALLIQRVARLRAESAELMAFIFQQVHSPRFHAYVDRINTSSGIPHISARQIKDYPIHFTSEAEQQRIADCLSSLDTQITAETHQLAALKSHKQGLMQQLFPAPEAAGA